MLGSESVSGETKIKTVSWQLLFFLFRDPSIQSSHQDNRKILSLSLSTLSLPGAVTTGHFPPLVEVCPLAL